MIWPDFLGKSPSMITLLRALAFSLLRLGLLAVTLATLAGYLAGFHWVLELFSHFRVQLAAGALLLLALALFLGGRWSSGLALAVLLANLYPVWPYLPGIGRAEAEQPPSLRVMAFNLHNEHADLARIEAYLARKRPDLVLLTELPPGAMAWLASLRTDYPHQALDRPVSIFDVALLSRRPIAATDFDRSVSPYLPVMTARLCAEETTEPAGCLTVVGLHAANPLGASALRDRQLRLAAQKSAAVADGAVLLLGDLNTTPWSPIFGEVLEQGGLRDSAQGFALKGTWLNRNPLFGLPIDHALLGEGLASGSREVGPDLGSDHYPVVTDIYRR